jgi:hypothetical protein
LGEEKDKARLLENEGFYVGNRPYMTIKNRNMMEDRFLRLPDNVSLTQTNLRQTQIICRNFKTNCQNFDEILGCFYLILNFSLKFLERNEMVRS